MTNEKLITHYDNLKVARNAGVEVMSGAYRALAQKFHPDKFPDRALAEHRMKVINKAYESCQIRIDAVSMMYGLLNKMRLERQSGSCSLRRVRSSSLRHRPEQGGVSPHKARCEEQNLMTLDDFAMAPQRSNTLYLSYKWISHWSSTARLVF